MSNTSGGGASLNMIDGGMVAFFHDSGNHVDITAPASNPPTTYAIRLPQAQPSINDVLKVASTDDDVHSLEWSGGSGGNSFYRIAVSEGATGVSNPDPFYVTADQSQDTFGLITGDNIRFTGIDGTDPEYSTVEIEAFTIGGSFDSYVLIALDDDGGSASGGTLEATTSNDTLTFIAGDNITLQSVPNDDTIKISASGTTGGPLGGNNTWTGINTFNGYSTFFYQMAGFYNGAAGEAAFIATVSPGQFEEGFWLKNESTPATPTGGYIRVFSSTGSALSYKTASGTVISLAGSTSSSLALKDNVRTIEIDTSKVLTLSPKTFEWKDDAETVPEHMRGVKDFGLIAEEVHEILPELIIYNGNNEPAAINYHMISVLLLGEMKKLKARIEILEGN